MDAVIAGNLIDIQLKTIKIDGEERDWYSAILYDEDSFRDRDRFFSFTIDSKYGKTLNIDDLKKSMQGKRVTFKGKLTTQYDSVSKSTELRFKALELVSK